MTMCAGNALECAVHHSPWQSDALSPVVSQCQHTYLSGRPHVHNIDGQRVHIGDAEPGLHCDCRDDPADIPTQDYTDFLRLDDV